MIDFFKKRVKPKPEFPPRPVWRPSIEQPLERIVERARYYYGDRFDLVFFKHGTCALAAGEPMEDAALIAYGLEVLAAVFNAHPDFDPKPMQDGNVLVTYNHPAFNVVLDDVVAENWTTIDKLHLDALATSEVLMTPLGPNVFDDFGKKALFGRCFMFMDAQEPEVVKITRRDA